ncbi:hypothetical protein MO767_26865 [Pseudomonas sp. UYIF39]|uniref:hypothetical protein n=1 Tax=Pseudomonas sp. UYIF39 TaxID=1630747 RepID=UPI00249E8F35|nr:hypothetical protein [Pseudomonas sp. UYIF39]MDI3357935.1 hypothetical protein [Pseudomonas sp. UYIF39]
MAVSFGIAKIISEHPSYNYGLALPFVIVFYLLNSANTYVVPFFEFDIGIELSAILKIFLVIGCYITFVLFLLFSSALSLFVKNSKLHLGWPIFTAVASLLTLVFKDENPLFGMLFGLTAIIYLAVSRLDNGSLSVVLIQGVFGFFSIFCFVTGILWLNESFVFVDIISSLFGFESIAKDSVKVGAFMLIVLGYSVFYSVFKAGELLSSESSA